MRVCIFTPEGDDDLEGSLTPFRYTGTRKVSFKIARQTVMYPKLPFLRPAKDGPRW